MKIGELNMHCGNCPIIDYCTAPYESPVLCCVYGLKNIDTQVYKNIAERVTDHDIQEKLKHYEKNGIEWSNERAGAICECVLEKIYSKGR